MSETNKKGGNKAEINKELIDFMGYEFSSTFGLLVNEIYNTYGAEGLTIIEKAMEKKGQLAAIEMKNAGIEINNFIDFGRHYGKSLRGQANSLVSNTNIEVISPDEVVLVHTSCNKFEAWRELGLPAEIITEICRLNFKATESLFFEFFPDAEMIKESLIPRGDQACRIRFKR